MAKLKAEDIARVCHEANRAYCVALGDTSQPAWDEAPTWQQQSAIVGVQSFSVARDGRDQHESWMYHKLKDGWRYGPIKDVDAKTHPSLLPYTRLTKEEQAKDSLFRAVCGALFGV